MMLGKMENITQVTSLSGGIEREVHEEIICGWRRMRKGRERETWGREEIDVGIKGKSTCHAPQDPTNCLKLHVNMG